MLREWTPYFLDAQSYNAHQQYPSQCIHEVMVSDVNGRQQDEDDVSTRKLLPEPWVVEEDDHRHGNVK